MILAYITVVYSNNPPDNLGILWTKSSFFRLYFILSKLVSVFYTKLFNFILILHENLLTSNLSLFNRQIIQNEKKKHLLRRKTDATIRLFVSLSRHRWIEPDERPEVWVRNHQSAALKETGSTSVIYFRSTLMQGSFVIFSQGKFNIFN